MKNYNDIIKAAREAMENSKQRSAWKKGVTVYALELLDEIKESIDGGWMDAEALKSPKMLEKAMLNGASDWKEYSWGGSSLIYNPEIARRLCNPTELRITREGQRDPNKREDWLDVQARALFQASLMVKDALHAEV